MNKSTFWGAVGVFIMYLCSIVMIACSIYGIIDDYSTELVRYAIVCLLFSVIVHIGAIMTIVLVTSDDK